jgi:hypothetical protein
MSATVTRLWQELATRRTSTVVAFAAPTTGAGWGKFIREQDELPALRECFARTPNSKDIHEVRARWDAYERYGCGALEDSFFDPRNG